jgi:hypothetical protein
MFIIKEKQVSPIELGQIARLLAKLTSTINQSTLIKTKDFVTIVTLNRHKGSKTIKAMEQKHKIKRVSFLISMITIPKNLILL